MGTSFLYGASKRKLNCRLLWFSNQSFRVRLRNIAYNGGMNPDRAAVRLIVPIYACYQNLAQVIYCWAKVVTNKKNSHFCDCKIGLWYGYPYFPDTWICSINMKHNIQVNFVVVEAAGSNPVTQTKWPLLERGAVLCFLSAYGAALQVQSRSFYCLQTFADDDEYPYNFRAFLKFF